MHVDASRGERTTVPETLSKARAMRFRTVAIAVAIAILVGLLVWVWAAHAVTSARLMMAEEQTAIFDDMVTQASSSLAGSSPNVTQAVQCLRYAHVYYPSGTKQPAGTLLDRIVERSRRASENRIIDLLRKAAGADCGADPEEWIKKYLSEPEVQRQHVH